MKYDLSDITKMRVLLSTVLLFLLTFIYYPPIMLYSKDVESMKRSIPIICKLNKYQKEQGDLPSKLEIIVKTNDEFLHYEKVSNQEFTLTIHDGFDPTATYKSTKNKWIHWREVPFPLKKELVKVDCQS
jgi:hypothetical protein